MGNKNAYLTISDIVMIIFIIIIIRNSVGFWGLFVLILGSGRSQVARPLWVGEVWAPLDFSSNFMVSCNNNNTSTSHML